MLHSLPQNQSPSGICKDTKHSHKTHREMSNNTVCPHQFASLFQLDNSNLGTQTSLTTVNRPFAHPTIPHALRPSTSIASPPSSAASPPALSAAVASPPLPPSPCCCPTHLLKVCLVLVAQAAHVELALTRVADDDRAVAKRATQEVGLVAQHAAAAQAVGVVHHLRRAVVELGKACMQQQKHRKSAHKIRRRRHNSSC